MCRDWSAKKLLTLAGLQEFLVAIPTRQRSGRFPPRNDSLDMERTKGGSRGQEEVKVPRMRNDALSHKAQLPCLGRLVRGSSVQHSDGV